MSSKTEKLYMLVACLSLVVLALISMIGDVQISRESAFLYHITMALGVVAVATGISFQGIVLYNHNTSLYRILPGCIFLFIGSVTFVHVMSYPGMPIKALLAAKNIENGQLPAWTSITARLVQSIGLWLVWRKPDMPLKKSCLFYYSISGIITIAVIWLFITQASKLPVLFIAGQGGTPLKILLENIIIVGFCATLWSIYKVYRIERTPEGLNLMLGYVFLIGGQSIGTFFASINSIDILTAHAYRLCGFSFLLRSLCISSIVKPFEQKQAALQALRTAQGQLTVSENRFRTLVNSMDDFIATLDRQHRFTSIYGAWYRQQGIAVESLMGSRVDDILVGPVKTFYLENLEKAYAGQEVSFEWSYAFSDGLKHFHTTLTPLEQGEFDTDTVLIVSHDITTLKSTEKRLMKQTNLLDVLHWGTAEFIRKNHSSTVFGAMLDRLLHVTGSDYAFLEGEKAGQNEKDSVFLSWECISDEFVEQRDMLAKVVRCHADQVLQRQETILQDKAGETLPSLIGIPITSGEVSFGVLVLARLGSDYDEEKLKILRPFISTAGILLEVIYADNERRKAEKTAQEMKQVAEKALWSKIEFIAKVSHDLRTPMTGIIGMMEMLLDTQLNEQQRKYATVVYESASSLNIILNDILDLGKMGAQKIDLQIIPLQIRPLIEGVISLFSVKAKQNRTDIYLEFAADTPIVMGDPVRLRQILINLVSNAVKFTPNGAVVIRGWTIPGQNDTVIFHCEVSDSGCGIKESVQDQLFTPFYQVSSSIEQKSEGSGLGLAICKHLVELMGGTIGVSSKKGAGCTFWFSVPMPVFLEERESQTVRQEYRQSVSAAGSILVVEDNPVNRELVLMQLAKLNVIDVHVAIDGKEAVKSVEAHEYSIILMDCCMPWMDGFEATRIIRQFEQAKGRYTPIVALTSHVEDYYRAKCKEAGMDGFLSKPVTLNRLTEVLQQYTVSKANAKVSGELISLPESTDQKPIQELVDMDVVEDILELSRLKGCNMLVRLVELFADEFPKKCEQIASAAKTKDTITIKNISHSLKSGSAAIGAQELVKLCAAMEAQASEGNVENVGDFLKAIQQCFRNTKAVYEKIA
ncbi:MASE3 domain-containing protein [Sporomusa aerivorans]|uniref:MASE3 domain-containing protein n=1 Tax=Sporomusa aerivorans TaxID=204936 RepID=UPI00352AF767